MARVNKVVCDECGKMSNGRFIVSQTGQFIASISQSELLSDSSIVTTDGMKKDFCCPPCFLKMISSELMTAWIAAGGPSVQSEPQ